MRNLLVLLALVSGILAVGCKNDQTASNSTPPAMTPLSSSPAVQPDATPSATPSAPSESTAPSSAPSSAPSAAPASGGGDASKIAGTWKADPNSLKMTIADKSPAAQAELQKTIAMIKTNMKGSSMTFKADGTYVATDAKGTKQTGKFSVKGNTVTVVDDLNASAPEPTITITDHSRMAFHMEGKGNTLDLDMVRG